MECIECGKEIQQNETYYSCLDNFLQVKYFDSEKENVFCSKKCFCESLSLTQLENDETSDIQEDEMDGYDMKIEKELLGL